MKGITKASLAVFAVALMVAVPLAVIDTDDSEAASVVKGDTAVSFKSNGNMDTAAINDLFSTKFLNNDLFGEGVCSAAGLSYSAFTTMSDLTVTYKEMGVNAAVTGSCDSNTVTIQKAEKYQFKVTMTGTANSGQPIFDILKVTGDEEFTKYVGDLASGDKISIEFDCVYNNSTITTTIFTSNSKGDLLQSNLTSKINISMDVKSAVIKITPAASTSDVKTVTLKAQSISESSLTTVDEYKNGTADVTDKVTVRATYYRDNDVKFTGTYTIGDKTYNYTNDDPNNYKKSETVYSPAVVTPVKTDIKIQDSGICYYGTASGVTSITILMPNVAEKYQNNDALKTQLGKLGTTSENYNTAQNIVNDIKGSMPSIYGSSSSSNSSLITWIIIFLAILLLLCIALTARSK